MAEREQSKGRQRPEDQEVETEEAQPIERDSEADRKLDELLDEIDQVLEENSEEFVRNYVQKGGE
jgi:ubiquitin-like protein Pup